MEIDTAPMRAGVPSAGVKVRVSVYDEVRHRTGGKIKEEQIIHTSGSVAKDTDCAERVVRKAEKACRTLGFPVKVIA